MSTSASLREHHREIWVRLEERERFHETLNVSAFLKLSSTRASCVSRVSALIIWRSARAPRSELPTPSRTWHHHQATHHNPCVQHRHFHATHRPRRTAHIHSRAQQHHTSLIRDQFASVINSRGRHGVYGVAIREPRYDAAPVISGLAPHCRRASLTGATHRAPQQ